MLLLKTLSLRTDNWEGSWLFKERKLRQNNKIYKVVCILFVDCYYISLC